MRFLLLWTESVETIPFTINLNLSLSDAAASWFRNCLRRDHCSTLPCPMKFNLRSLADAGKRAPSPRTRWCSYCKRNEHHLCSGTGRVNHGRTVPCECLQGDRHDPNRRLALNRPPPISLRTNTAVGRCCYLVADQAHPANKFSRSRALWMTRSTNSSRFAVGPDESRSAFSVNEPVAAGNLKESEPDLWK